jgi:NitT/TauT family transport system permease protein
MRRVSQIPVANNETAPATTGAKSGRAEPGASVQGLGRRRRRRRLHWREALASIGLFVVVILALEQLLPALGIRSYIFPTPSSVLAALVVDLQTPTFWTHVLTTLEEILAGWLIGAFAGFLLGVLLTQSSFLDAALTPYIVALQAVPKVALAPVIVIALGHTEISKIVIAAIVSFFPVLVNVMVGIRGADPQRLELMRSLRASRWQTLLWVELPGAMPTIFGGLEVAVVFSVVGAIVGEFTGASRGLGYLIGQRDFSLNQAGVFSVLIVLSAIGLGLDVAVRYVGKRVVKWQRIGEAVGV